MKKQHREHWDVTIIGAGMVGLSFACALKGTGLSVLLLERQQAKVRYSLQRDCRVSAMVAGSIDLLKGLGVWQELAAHASPIHAMRIWDAQYSGSIRFEADELGLPSLGVILENSRTQDALLDALHDDPHIEYRCPAELRSLHWQHDAVSLHFADGRSASTSLVVGADGGRSWLRQYAGIAVHKRDYQQQGIVATVKPSGFHHQQAFQRFMATGPLALLPMHDGLCSMVWSADNSKAEQLMALDDLGFRHALYHAFGPLLGTIEAVGERAAFPLVAQLAHHLVRPRLALIGDAAHTIHPLAGLGVNLGIRDAMSLAQELLTARRFAEDIGCMATLERYQQNRTPNHVSVMAGMEALHQVFRLPAVAPMRAMGMRLLGNSGMLKRTLMRQSMGLTLNLPKRICVS